MLHHVKQLDNLTRGKMQDNEWIQTETVRQENQQKMDIINAIAFSESFQELTL